MFLDLHAHSAGISRCCRAPITKVLEVAKTTGFDGIVLTNHYTRAYFAEGEEDAFTEQYIAEYEAACTCGAALGLRVLFGMEVGMERYTPVHLLVYGITPDMLRALPTLYDMTQAELYAHVHALGGVVVQAHPFRKNKNNLLDTALLDGVELNCHPLYKDGTHRGGLCGIAARDGLFVTCGCDYHADTHRAKAGTYLPDDITDTIALAQYLKRANPIRLRLQEPWETNGRDFTFTRG